MNFFEVIESLFNKVIKRVQGFFSTSKQNLTDPSVYHRLSLIAFFAWVGLGADGLSSSCYGPEEAFLALGQHPYLSIFVALASAITIFIISYSYSQIIELFPNGGGGYMVASKLLNPSIGMISGCALVIDYVLTITISVASGSDALFSFLPVSFHPFKFHFAFLGIVILTLMNLRGVKETVKPLIPIFMVFLITHVFLIVYAIFTHSSDLPAVVTTTSRDVGFAWRELGTLGLVMILLKSYSMGAGTYTGIEAVSNGVSLLREPKVKTAKRTMLYMATSLSFMVFGLLVAYLLFKVSHVPGKTLNAVLIESVTSHWGFFGSVFLWVTLLSEALLLFIAAQAGFLDGPRILASMAIDRWFPTRFALLNERFVARNGIVIMGLAALGMLILTHGSVRFLVVLYSINVFITFVLSQLGMVRHWWLKKAVVRDWFKKFCINGVGLCLCLFILIAVTVIKFEEGGWITMFITLSFAFFAFIIKRHYYKTAKVIFQVHKQYRLEGLPEDYEQGVSLHAVSPQDSEAHTAVLFVNGFDGIGIHTLNTILNQFGGLYKNFIFVQIGVVDAGNFKGAEEIENLSKKIESDVKRYVGYVQRKGYYGDGYYGFGTDIIQEVLVLVPQILVRFPKAMFFGGFLVFKEETMFSRFLHNHTVFALQQRLCLTNVPFVAIPIKI